jgi:hemolysin activation/secretion protein
VDMAACAFEPSQRVVHSHPCTALPRKSAFLSLLLVFCGPFGTAYAVPAVPAAVPAVPAMPAAVPASSVVPAVPAAPMVPAAQIAANPSASRPVRRPASRPVPGADAVLIAELKGLRLVDSEAKVAPRVTGSGLIVEGLPLLQDPGILSRLEGFLHKPLGQGDLAMLRKEILDWYVRRNLPYAEIIVPERQDIGDGILQMVVLEDPLILPHLTGIKLMNGIQKLKPEGVSGEGVIVEGLPKLNARSIRNKLAAFIGKPLTRGSMGAITKTIISWYDSRDRPFLDVSIPAGQNITSGVIQVVVTESHVGRIRVVGNKWFSARRLASELRIRPGTEISRTELREDADWLTQNPFHHQELTAQTQAQGSYRVTIETSAGSPGRTDVTVKAADRFPLTASFRYDNSGTPVLTRDRWTYGLDWGNALWLDHQLSYRYITSDANLLHGRIPYQAHSLAYVIPLSWHDTLTLSGAYALARPELGPDLGLTGIIGQASLRYSILLPSIGNDPVHQVPILSQTLQFGFDFKSTNNNLLFGGTQVSNTTTEIDQFPIVYNAALNDRFGQTSLENDFVYSPGGLSSRNHTSFFAAQTGASFVKPTYIYDHLAIERVTRLPADSDWAAQLGWIRNASWLMKVVAQTSSRSLLPSEQMGIGGAESVRGYDEHEGGGSSGVLISEELRTPVFSLSADLAKQDFGDRSQLAAFWDFGAVHERVLPGGIANTNLESVGLSLYGAMSSYLDFRLNYGWQLRTAPGAASRGQFGHVSVSVRY